MSDKPNTSQLVVAYVGNDLYVALCQFHDHYGTPIGIDGKSMKEALENLIGRPAQEFPTSAPAYFGDYEVMFKWPDCQWRPPHGMIDFTNKAGKVKPLHSEEIFWFEPSAQPASSSPAMLPPDLYQRMSAVYAEMSAIMADYAKFMLTVK